MNQKSPSSKFWALAFILYSFSSGALSQEEDSSPDFSEGANENANGCQAVLDRVDKSFCLSRSFGLSLSSPTESSSSSETSPENSSSKLSYEWQVTEESFGINSPVCIEETGTKGDRRDLVIAIDRSQNLWERDRSGEKLGADHLELARRIIRTLLRESRDNPSLQKKVGLMLFSSKDNCRTFDSFNSKAISFDRVFPCVYLPAAPLDSQYGDRLISLLDAAEGLYSQGGMDAASDYRIVANGMEKNLFGLKNGPQPGVLLMSDGRSYWGEKSDTYAYLRHGNYKKAQESTLSLFSATRGLFRLAFAMSPQKNPALGRTHGDALDNMCTLDPQSDDCGDQIDFADPSTWKVNQLDIVAYGKALVQATGSSTDQAFIVENPQDIDVGLESLRFGGEAVVVESVEYSWDGQTFHQGQVDGQRIHLANLPSGDSYTVAMRVRTSNGVVEIPVDVKTERVTGDGEAFEDQEMKCDAGDTIEPAEGEPQLSLDDLQGGSGSCGLVQVAGVSSGDRGATNGGFGLLLMLLFLPLAVLTKRFRPATATVTAARGSKNSLLSRTGFLSRFFTMTITLGLGSGLATDQAAAQNKKLGLNALHHQPAVGGIGIAETASPTRPGLVKAGLFVDYANDTVEIGGSKGKRIDSVMDDLVTAQAAISAGVVNKLSFGLNIPYIQKTDLDRSLDGEETSGGQLGTPADMTIHGKIRLYRQGRIAISLMPMATVPTGNPEYLTGDGTANYGALVLVSGSSGRLVWTYNGGYLQRDKPLVLSDDRTRSVVVRGQVVNRGGAEFWMKRSLAFAGNLHWKISAGERVDFTRTNPAEWTASVRWRPIGALDLQSGFGTGIGKGFGAPDYRVWAGMSYVPRAKSSGARTRRAIARRSR